MAEPYYATAEALRKKLSVTAEILPDSEAIEIIEEAEDLIDERLGVRPVDEDTGRKVVPAEETEWRVAKLAKATVEVAVVLYRDPDAARRQRHRSESGEVSTSGPYGPAYGQRAAALLQQSGLARPWAMAGGRRGGRNSSIAQSFSEQDT